MVQLESVKNIKIFPCQNFVLCGISSTVTFNDCYSELIPYAVLLLLSILVNRRGSHKRHSLQ